MATSTEGRRFSLLDGMILIAALGLGLAPARVIDRHRNPSRVSSVRNSLDRVSSVGTTVAMGLTLAAIGLSYRGRPGNARRWRPGFGVSLCVVALVGCLTFAGLEITTEWTEFQRQPAESFLASRSGETVLMVGPMVAGAYLSHVVAGRRRRSRHWTETLARLTGVLWVVLFVLWCCGLYL